MSSSRKESAQQSMSSDSPTSSEDRTKDAPLFALRKPMPRKGHTKSRRGCYNCKRRRIKCNEKHPSCQHCTKTGLQCEYPPNIVQAVQRCSHSTDPKEVVTLRFTPGVFSTDDMRFFHHFLITAYPHLPVGADKIWITDIPAIAHNYEYLMHSILALAASHLSAVTRASVGEQAIRHRIIAVKSLNNALSNPSTSRIETDARMAAALALTFQSSHLPDGLAEFMTMVRGCNLVSTYDHFMDPESLFHAFRRDGHFETMKSRIGTSRLFSVSPVDLDLAAASLRDIGQLNLSDWERDYWHILNATVENGYERPVESYESFVTLYNTPSKWTHDEFRAFIDSNNSVGQILLAHFIAIQAILTPILYLERVGFQGIDAPTAVLSWIESIYVHVPLWFRSHVEWPMQVAKYPFMRFLGQRVEQEQAQVEEFQEAPTVTT